MPHKSLSRSVSLASATFIIVGYVVGATIFVLPGSLAASTGPAVFVAYALAAVPAIVAGFVMAQIGSALPVSGALYILLRDTLAPLFGFVYIWLMVSLGAVVIPLVAFGFADYLGYFIPALNATVVAMTVVVLFVILNFFGMRVASLAQNAMVIVFLAALAIFGIAGLTAGDPGKLSPLLPNGFAALGIATITAYFSYAGVFVIAEIAGEIRDPDRNIPLSILIAFIVIILLYTLVPLALAMVISWQDLGSTPMAVVTASGMILPGPVVTLIAVAALFAAATSVNGIMMGLSRDFFQGATNKLFPHTFAVISERTQTPGRAVLLVGALSILGIAFGGTITNYAQLALIGLMVIQVMTGIALIRLPTKLPVAYERSGFRLSRPWLAVVGVAHVGFSCFFLLMLASEKPVLLLAGLAFLIVGLIYYQFWPHIPSGISHE